MATVTKDLAKEHADTMRRYCRLHHEKRLADFAAGDNPGWDKHLVKRIVEQSQEIIDGRSGNDGWGSIDLDDTEYLAELDAWNEARQTKGI